MIRHPDMPEEAFRDMWETIAGGWPWSAAVKNRRKDGSYYWVMANVTPLMEDGRPVGYMSVRTEASREQIAGAEALYARTRAEKQAGRTVHALQRGRLVRRTVSGRIAEALDIGLAGRVALAFAALWLAAVLAAWVGPQAGLLAALAWLAVTAVAFGGYA